MKIFLFVVFIILSGCSKIEYVVLDNECSCETVLYLKNDKNIEILSKKIAKYPIGDVFLGENYLAYILIEQKGVRYKYQNKKFDPVDFRNSFIDANIFSEDKYHLKINSKGDIFIMNKSKRWIFLADGGFEKFTYTLPRS